MSYLETTIRYDQFIHWGAPARLNLSEDQFREAYFKTVDRATLGEVIDTLVRRPDQIVWSLAREDVLDARTLHGLGAELLSSFLMRLKHEGTYIDFRTARLGDVKGRVARGAASLGELAAARQLGERAWDDVALLGDQKASAGATAAVAAAKPDLREGLLKLATVMYTTHARPDDFVKMAVLVRCFLATRSPAPRAS